MAVNSIGNTNAHQAAQQQPVKKAQTPPPPPQSTTQLKDIVTISQAAKAAQQAQGNGGKG